MDVGGHQRSHAADEPSIPTTASFWVTEFPWWTGHGELKAVNFCAIPKFNSSGDAQIRHRMVPYSSGGWHTTS